MARLIPPKEKFRRRFTYPWEKWLEPGTTWELKQGEDYAVSGSSFENLARLTAKRLKRQTSVLCRDGGSRVILVNHSPLADGKSATRRK